MTESTNNLPAPVIETGHRELIHPRTGEVLALADHPANALAALLDDLDDYLDDVKVARREVELELIDRLDRRGRRSGDVEGADLETNAPTTEEYDVGKLRAALEPLVAAKVIDRALVDELITYPPPAPPPAPRVDKRAANRLKKSDKPEVLRALGAARTVVNQRRTLKVRAYVPTVEAEEVAPDA